MSEDDAAFTFTSGSISYKGRAVSEGRGGMVGGRMGFLTGSSDERTVVLDEP